MVERGIYLTAPDGRIICELRCDPKLRARQRWYRTWQPHQNVKPDRKPVISLSCNPSNPSKLCQI